MTIIRQWAITNSTRGDMRRLMNEDERIMIRGEQFLPSINGGAASWRKWDSLMEATRKSFGHDKPSRHLRDKMTGEMRPARNTIMYHQILSFLADDCDINGGKLTPEECMAYAKEYIEKYYPTHEVVYAVLKDRYASDGIENYVVHLIINRSDLSSGKRMNEGRADATAKIHANRIRAMDVRWVIWNLLNDGHKYPRISYGTKIYAYHFRLADVCNTIHDGLPYKGRVRIGVERMPNFPTVPSDKLDVVIYDHDGGVIAKVRANDWSASDVRSHIGDTTDEAMLFCDKGGHCNVMFLHMLVVWHSEECSYRRPSFNGSAFHYPSLISELVKVTAPEALSDLKVGESFEAVPLDHYGEIGLSRQAYNYEFAKLPSALCEAFSKLAATAYPMTIPCINRGMVRTGDGWASMVQITLRSPSEMRELARFRDESGLDVRFEDDYEVIRLEPVDNPIEGIPFGDVVVEYIPIPLPGRKNPLVELHVNDVKIGSARYRDDQYTIYKERSGKRSRFARLHYDEHDVPYLDVIWKLNEVDNRETVDDE